MRRVGDFVKAMLRAERSYFVRLHHEGPRLLDRFGIDNVPGAVFQISRPIFEPWRRLAAWRREGRGALLATVQMGKRGSGERGGRNFQKYSFFHGFAFFISTSGSVRNTG